VGWWLQWSWIAVVSMVIGGQSTVADVCRSSPSDSADQLWRLSRSAYYSDDLQPSSFSMPQSRSFLLLKTALQGITASWPTSTYQLDIITCNYCTVVVLVLQHVRYIIISVGLVETTFGISGVVFAITVHWPWPMIFLSRSISNKETHQAFRT